MTPIATINYVDTTNGRIYKVRSLSDCVSSMVCVTMSNLSQFFRI